MSRSTRAPSPCCHTVCVLATLLLMASTAHGQGVTVSKEVTGQLLLTPFIAISSKNMTLELTQDPSAPAPPVNINLGQVTLAPCGMLSMHSHAGVDELVHVLVGNITAALAWANGTITTATVSPGQAFALPQDLVHTLINPSCSAPTSTLHIFSSVNPAGVSVAAAAWALPGSPFQAYSDPSLNDSEVAAQTFFAYDPVCLARCGLGTTFGQAPSNNTQPPTNTTQTTLPNRKMLQ